jgi:titin
MSLIQKLLIGSRALTALSLAFGFSFLSLVNSPAKAGSCASGFESTDIGCTRTFTPGDTDRAFTVPTSVSSLDIEMFGGAGGLGGRDCGTGCTIHLPSQVGHAHFTLPVTAGNTIGIWPGSAAGNGRDGVNTAGGGGSAGQSSYLAGKGSGLYNGGAGGSTGPAGTSGAGGGGGAATLVSVDNNLLIVAGGGGAGGAANASGSGGDGISKPDPAKSSNGTNGASPNCDYGS